MSNAGGAVGFPFLAVTVADVRDATVAMAASLSDHVRLLVAIAGGSVAGWLLLSMNDSPLTAHSARVTRVQTDLPCRGQGVAVALMTEVARLAADGLGLEQLHLELPSGMGLEAFYEKLGWQEIGRWPAALRLAQGDDRDEVLMLLSLHGHMPRYVSGGSLPRTGAASNRWPRGRPTAGGVAVGAGTARSTP